MNWQEVCDEPTLRDLLYKIELNEWGQIVMSPATNRHGILQGLLIDALYRLKEVRLAKSFQSVRFKHQRALKCPMCFGCRANFLTNMAMKLRLHWFPNWSRLHVTFMDGLTGFETLAFFQTHRRLDFRGFA